MNVSLTFICCLFFITINAQQINRIDTDRPDQTESPNVIPKKYFQAEFGFGKENLEGSNYDLAIPSFLFRYGLSKKVELRLGSNLTSKYTQLIPNPKKSTNLEPIEIGTKISLFDENGILPKTAVLLHLGLPFLSTDYDRDQNVFPTILFAFQNSFSEKTGIGYSAGVTWDGYSNSPTWLYTISPNVNIGRNWYAYIEAFGFLKNGAPAENNLDTGIAYYISSNSKIDFSAGIGLGANSLKNYIAVGFSFRVPFAKSSTK